MSLTDKLSERLRVMESVARAMGEGQEVFSALAECERTIKRAAKRAEALPEGYERVEFVQTRGPRVEFTGRLLVEHGHDSRKGYRHEAEIWETRGGALIAMSATMPLDGEGFEDVRVAVVEPVWRKGDDLPENLLAMRFAVMDHFNWDMGVRSAVTKKLGWKLSMEVE